MTKSKKKSQPFPIIHKNECKACNRCVIACKKGVIELVEDFNDIGYNYVKYTGEGCNGCGDCFYTCPEPLAIEVHVPKKIAKNKNENQINDEEG